MVARSDERLSCIHTSFRNMSVLSWVNFYLKSVKVLFLLSKTKAFRAADLRFFRICKNRLSHDAAYI